MSVYNIVEIIDGKYVLKDLLLQSIVDKCVDRCDSIALVSVIGPQFEGKTFLINCFLNYLQSNDKNNWPKTDSTILRWDYGFRNDYSEGWRPVVQMWSEPLILGDDNQRIAVFLMDSSHVFNSFHQIIDSKLMSDMIKLFSYTSSTLVFNKSCVFTKNDRKRLQKNIEKSFEFIKPIDSYQNLFIVIRDWDLICGNQEFCGEEEGKVLKNELNGLQLEKYWHEIECYLMSSPDSGMRRTDWKLSELNIEFTKQLSEFIKTKLFNINEMQIKTRPNASHQPIKPNEFIKLFKHFINDLNESNVETDRQELEKSEDLNKSESNRSQSIDTEGMIASVNASIRQISEYAPNSTIFGKKSEPVFSRSAEYPFGCNPMDSNQNDSYSPSVYRSSNENKEKSVKKEEIIEPELQEYKKKSIDSFKKFVLKRINSNEFDWDSNKVLNDMKSQIMTAFDHKWRNKRNHLIRKFRSELSQNIDYEKDFFNVLATDRLSSVEKEYELVLKNSIDFFNNYIQNAIENDIKNNTEFKPFSKIFEEIKEKTKNEFTNKTKKLLKTMLRKKFTKLINSLGKEKEKYLKLYERYDSYENECEYLFKTERYFSVEKLYEIKEKFNESNIEFKELLQQMVEKTTNRYKSRLNVINRKEEQIANQSIDLALDLFKSCFEFRLKSGLFSQNDIKSIHQKLLNYTLKQLRDCCHFNSNQQNLIEKCEKELKSRAEPILNSNSREHKKAFTETTKSLKSTESYIYRKYCEDMRQEISNNNYLKANEFQKLHKRIENDLMVIQRERLNGIENYFNKEFAKELVNGNETDIKNSINSIKQRFMKENDSKAPKTSKAEEMIRELSETGIANTRNRYEKKYEEEMEEWVKKVDSEEDLKGKHREIKDRIIEEFSQLSSGSETALIDTHLQQLIEAIDDSLEEFIDVWNIQMENQKGVTELLISETRKWYKEELDKHFQKTLFIRTDRLEQINDTIVDQTIRHFESNRGNMSFGRFEELIKDNMNAIFNTIKAENDMNTPTLPAIGIDLGTTNSCVAYFEPRKPEGKVIVIENDFGKNTTPSVVEFCDDGSEVVGEAAKEDFIRNPRNVVFSAQRLIGRKFTDSVVQNDMKNWSFEVIDGTNHKPKISVDVNGQNQTYFAEQISAKVLKKMKEMAEKKLGLSVRNAVITVPAYFNDTQKEATKDAGTIAGLNVLKIINEPTAAAIAYHLNRRDDRNARNVLIYDFDVETFDVAVLSIYRGNVDIKAVNGDNHLGGDDIDNNIVQYCLDQFFIKSGIRVSKGTAEEEKALRRLRICCEKQKWQLSTTDSTTITVDAFSGQTNLEVVLTREKFEELNNDLFTKTMVCVEQALTDAQISHSDIDDIVLVGGSTRIPRIQEMLSDLFGGKQLNHSINPDEAVAVGAAIMAAQLNGNQAQTLGYLKVRDRAPMSLGVKIKDGFMSVIYPRNSKVPNSYSQTYQTSSDNQTEFDVEIYEGKEQMVADNRRLGTFRLSNIPSALAGEQKIEVSFEINDEGILNVSAKCMSTGGEHQLVVTRHKGRLTENELQALIEQN